MSEDKKATIVVPVPEMCHVCKTEILGRSFLREKDKTGVEVHFHRDACWNKWITNTEPFVRVILQYGIVPVRTGVFQQTKKPDYQVFVEQAEGVLSIKLGKTQDVKPVVSFLAAAATRPRSKSQN